MKLHGWSKFPSNHFTQPPTLRRDPMMLVAMDTTILSLPTFLWNSSLTCWQLEFSQKGKTQNRWGFIFHVDVSFWPPRASGSCSLEMGWRRPPGERGRFISLSLPPPFFLFSLSAKCSGTLFFPQVSHLTCPVTPVSCSRNTHTQPPGQVYITHTQAPSAPS